MNNYFLPIRELYSDWPQDILPADDLSFLDKIGIDDYSLESQNGFVIASGTLIFVENLEFNVPGIESAKLKLLHSEGNTTLSFKVELSEKRLDFELQDVSVTLSFVSNIIKSVNPETKEPLENSEYEITFSCSVGANTEDGVYLSDSPSVTLPPFAVGNSGIVVDIGKAALAFRPKDVAKLAEDIPTHWKGIYLEEATISLPKDFNLPIDNITVEKAFIGSGGFSGSFSGEGSVTMNSDGKTFSPATTTHGTLFGIPIALKELQLEFKQNSFVNSSIEAVLILPFFDAPVDCTISFDNDGDFSVGLKTTESLPGDADFEKVDGLFVFQRDEIMRLIVKSLEFKKEGDVFSIGIGGSIKPLFLGDFWPKFDIDKLTIDSEGNVDIDGGWINLPKAAGVNFYGFNMELQNIGFGREGDKNWFGLSGGISLVDGVPMRGSVKGLKVFWGGDETRFEIGGIGVGFDIKEVLSFDGEVLFNNQTSDEASGFGGTVKLDIYPLGISSKAQFIAGKVRPSATNKDSFNYFAISVDAQWPAPILMGASGLGIYGMEGLFTYNLDLNKDPSDAWYREGVPQLDPNTQELITTSGSDAGFFLKDPYGIKDVTSWKWHPVQDSRAFGAGIVLGTIFDNGFTVSGRLMLVILIPGPIVILEGGANVFKDRGEISKGEPIFGLLMVLDNRAGTFLLNISMNYKIPDSGKLIDIGGNAEVFFDYKNKNRWHFYLGQNEPRSRRLRAYYLALFGAEAYFMIDNKGFAVGAWAGWDKKWKFGPLRVILAAWIEGHFSLNWNPIQARAAIILNGDVELKAFGRGIGMSVRAELVVSTPNPWYIGGKFKVKINLPWPLPDPKATVKLSWGSETGTPDFVSPIGSIGIWHKDFPEVWEIGHEKRIVEGESETLIPIGTTEHNAPIVPMDARLLVNFAKPVDDTLNLGVGNIMPMFDDASSQDSPEEKAGKFKFQYKLKEVKLEAMHPTKGTRTVGHVFTPSNEEQQLLQGAWQAIPGKQENIRLMLGTVNSFEYVNQHPEEIIPIVERLYEENDPCKPIPPNYTLFGYAEEITCNGSNAINFGDFGIIATGMIDCHTFFGESFVEAWPNPGETKVCVDIENVQTGVHERLNSKGISISALDVSTNHPPVQSGVIDITSIDNFPYTNSKRIDTVTIESLPTNMPSSGLITFNDSLYYEQARDENRIQLQYTNILRNDIFERRSGTSGSWQIGYNKDHTFLTAGDKQRFNKVDLEVHGNSIVFNQRHIQNDQYTFQDGYVTIYSLTASDGTRYPLQQNEIAFDQNLHNHPGAWGSTPLILRSKQEYSSTGTYSPTMQIRYSGISSPAGPAGFRSVTIIARTKSTKPHRLALARDANNYVVDEGYIQPGPIQTIKLKVTDDTKRISKVDFWPEDGEVEIFEIKYNDGYRHATSPIVSIGDHLRQGENSQVLLQGSGMHATSLRLDVPLSEYEVPWFNPHIIVMNEFPDDDGPSLHPFIFVVTM